MFASVTRSTHRSPRAWRRLLIALAVTLVSIVGFAQPANASVDTTYVEGSDKQAFMYNPLAVSSFALTMTDEDRDYINGEVTSYDARVYKPATLVITSLKGTSQTFEVGVHLKGGWGSSRSLDEKAGFKVKMDFSVTGQNYYGITKFTLNNMVQDPTMLHEALSYRLFRAMGVPAPRVGYSTVSVTTPNRGTVDYGLHAVVETYDKEMFKRWPSLTGSTKSNHIYEGGYGHEVGLEMQVDQGSDTERADISTLASITANYSGENWFTRFRGVADINEMVMTWAIERYISHWDGYSRPGGWPNNYYVRIDGNGLATMHPWGTDQTWNDGWLTNFTDDGAPLYSRCINYQPCLDLYRAALARIQSKVASLNLPTMLDRIWTTVTSLHGGDAGSTDGTRSWIINRPSALSATLTDAATAGDTLPTLKLNFATTGFKPGAVFKPTVSRVGAGVISYVRVLGKDVCTVNPTTGATTIDGPGTCGIAAYVAKTDTRLAQQVTVFRDVPMMTSRLTVRGRSPLPKGQTMTMLADADSSGTASARRLSGSCRVSGMNVTALASSGTCRIKVTVAGDDSWFGTSKIVNVAMSR